MPGQESAEEEDVEEEEGGSQKDSQKALEKGQGAQQLKGKDMPGLESLGGGEKWTGGQGSNRGSRAWFSVLWFSSISCSCSTLTCLVEK